MKTGFQKVKDYIKSIKINLFIIILCASILPLAAMRIYIVDYYESTQIQERQDKIYSMAYMIKNLVISTDYLNLYTTNTSTSSQNSASGSGSNMFDAVAVELEQLTSIYSGRIVIVDSNLTIIKDTYVIEEYENDYYNELGLEKEGQRARQAIGDMFKNVK